MTISQDFSNELLQVDVAMAKEGRAPVDFVITPQHQAWIDYEALGGIITDSTDDAIDIDSQGKRSTRYIRKMRISEFAGLVGVDRRTLQNWRKQIPNFWERVAERRKQLNSQSRLAALHEKFYVQAMTFKNWPVTEAWMINFDPNYVTPKLAVDLKVEHGWAEILAAASREKVIEGEAVESSANPTGSSENQGALPATS